LKGAAPHYYSNSNSMTEYRMTTNAQSTANAKKFRESYGGSFEKKLAHVGSVTSNYAIPDSIDTGDDEDHTLQ